MRRLKAGDVLSYSSGRQDRGPRGFRILGQGGNLRALLEGKWPQLFRGFEGRIPLVINAYPAALGNLDFGVYVDTYLSVATGSRALELSCLENMPVMLLGQPLFLAELLFWHVSSGYGRLPGTLLLGTGGYPMPLGLELALRDLCVRRGVRYMNLFHGYGAAEVDACCLLAVERNSAGHLLYQPRDHRVVVDVGLGGELFLSLRAANGDVLVDRFATGDCGRKTFEGYVLWNDERCHPSVRELLESWGPSEWRRRTGYLHRGSETRVQLRKGENPVNELECEFHDFAKLYGQDWLTKPRWGCPPIVRPPL